MKPIIKTIRNWRYFSTIPEDFEENENLPIIKHTIPVKSHSNSLLFDLMKNIDTLHNILIKKELKYMQKHYVFQVEDITPKPMQEVPYKLIQIKILQKKAMRTIIKRKETV